MRPARTPPDPPPVAARTRIHAMVSRQQYRNTGSCGTPFANLQMTLLDKLGLAVERFGDSNGELKLVTGV